MKKRLCSLLLVLTMLSTLLVAPASALEADGSTSAGNETYVYLGVKDYGTVEADSKPNFVHRFYTNGEEVQYTIASSDNKYAVQNKLQEGYVYDLTIEGGVVTDAAAATADAEGTIASIDDSTVTVNGAAVKYSAIYEISNNAAGATAVTKVTDLSNLAGKTAKVYDGVVYLTFVAKPYTAPVSGKAGERTLKNYLKTALEPVGTTLYVYGAGWDWQDDLSSNQSMTIGLSQSWIDFFQQQDANYTYKNSADPAHSYYPHNSWNQYYYAGLDCSGYVGWVVYNVMHTQNSVNTDNDGYVMSSTKMAKTFADKGWGTWTRDIKSFKPGDYFYDAVNWAVEKGITTGTSATTFSPNASCTRAQIVTFLWRASGSPEPKTASNPFTDVAANAYYCKAVLWAVENGITTGTSATTFSPDAPCTRAQGVTFLWRANGSKAASAAASFTDVASDAYYAPAVAWAAEQNVTSGVGNGLFSSDTICTRAQIVSMLYRLR